MALGMRFRLSTQIAVQIATARARALSLPAANPVAPAILGGAFHPGPTWLDHAEHIAQSIGVTDHNDILNWRNHQDPQVAKVWKRTVAIPAAGVHDDAWLRAVNNRLDMVTLRLRQVLCCKNKHISSRGDVSPLRRQARRLAIFLAFSSVSRRTCWAHVPASYPNTTRALGT